MKVEPDLVVFDGERNLLAQLSHKLSEEELVYQLKNDPSLYGRLQAMDSLYSFKDKKLISEALEVAFNDPYYLIRQYAVEYLIDNEVKLKKYEPSVVKLLYDESPFVRTMTITYVGRHDFEKYRDIITKALMDSSYMVAGAAVNQFVENEFDLPSKRLDALSSENNLNLTIPMGMYYLNKTDEHSFQWFERKMQSIKETDLYYFIQIFSEKLLDASKPYRERAAASFQELAKNGSHYTTRLAAFQALHLLSDIEGVDESIDYIRKNEADERLLEWYQQF